MMSLDVPESLWVTIDPARNLDPGKGVTSY
jgi:hypothetical protein